jgi:integrase
MKGVFEQGGRSYGRFMYKGKRNDGHPLSEFTDHRGEPKNADEKAQAYDRFKEAVRTGKLYQPRNVDASMSVAQFVDHYVTTYWNDQERTSKGDVAMLSVIKEYFGTRPLSSWNDANTFTQFRNWLRDTPIPITRRLKDKKTGEFTIKQTPSKRFRAPSTLDHYRMRLSHMCAFAAAYDLVDKNVFLGDKIKRFMPKLAATEGRRRGVTSEEEKALYKACDQLAFEGEAMRERLEFALMLGPRRGEMQRIQLEDIDFDTWELTFPGYKTFGKKRVRNTKKGQTRIVPIPESLRPLLKGKRSLFKPTAFVFGNNGVYVESFRKAWDNVLRHAKLDDATLKKHGRMDLHWHDLRGEAGTRMLRKGHSAEVVAEILGNTPDVLRKHYKGDLMTAMRKAVEA